MTSSSDTDMPMLDSVPADIPMYLLQTMDTGRPMFNKDNIPTEINATIAKRKPNGFYQMVGDNTNEYYRVTNRSAPILQQISPDISGIKAVSDSVVYVPESSITENNQAVFAQRAMYLDTHRLGTSGMVNTIDQVLAQEKEKDNHQKTDCVRIDPCPEPSFKDLKCCNVSSSPEAALESKNTGPYDQLKMRDYNHKDSTWSFLVDRPYDKYAMIIMGITVGLAVFCVCVLLIWAMVTRQD